MKRERWPVAMAGIGAETWEFACRRCAGGYRDRDLGCIGLASLLERRVGVYCECAVTGALDGLKRHEAWLCSWKAQVFR